MVEYTFICCIVHGQAGVIKVMGWFQCLGCLHMVGVKFDRSMCLLGLSFTFHSARAVLLAFFVLGHLALKFVLWFPCLFKIILGGG